MTGPHQTSFSSRIMIQLQNSKTRGQLFAAGVCLVYLLLSSSNSTPKLSLKPGQCWKGNLQKTKLERLDDLQKTYSLEEMLEGPGLEYILDNNQDGENRSACMYVVDDSVPHYFKHPFQQLYRCFSWWQANPRKDPYLIIPKKAKFLGDTDFVMQWIGAMRELFGVRVVRLRHTLKVVRPVVEYVDHTDKHSFAMTSKADANIMRDTIIQHYHMHDNRLEAIGMDLPQTPCSIYEPPRIGVLDRQATRSLQNKGAIVRAIENAVGMGNVTFKLSSFDKRPFHEQVEYMNQVDVLITPHGAHLLTIPFMPKCSQLLELMPAGHYLPYLYGSLSAVSGVDHSYIYLGDADKAKHETKYAHSRIGDKDDTRTKAREEAGDANLCPDTDLIAQSAVQLIKEWKQCCQHR